MPKIIEKTNKPLVSFLDVPYLQGVPPRIVINGAFFGAPINGPTKCVTEVITKRSGSYDPIYKFQLYHFF